MLQEFKEQGFVHLENVIDNGLLEYTRDLAIKMKAKYMPSVNSFEFLEIWQKSSNQTDK